MNILLNEYLKILDYENIPDFLFKYIECPSLKRLKKVGYFCGMDYASKDIYDFGTYLSRFDHSLTTALITWKYSKNKIETISALFHDVSTPCFSHVIDYMNKDYLKQESTEEKTEEILKNDNYFIHCLENDNILIEDIIDFKKHSIIDLDRPMLCADRIDGIILNSLFWTKEISISEVNEIIKSIKVYKNEFKLLELGFDNKKIVKLILDKNNIVDTYCHSKYDNYMMELLAYITKLCINNNLFSYNDLYYLTEEDIIFRILSSNNYEILNLWYLFQNIKKEQIKDIELPLLKKRVINPLLNGKRIRGKYEEIN